MRHGVRSAVPAVEVTHEGHMLRVRRPNGKAVQAGFDLVAAERAPCIARAAIVERGERSVGNPIAMVHLQSPSLSFDSLWRLYYTVSCG